MDQKTVRILLIEDSEADARWIRDTFASQYADRSTGTPPFEWAWAESLMKGIRRAAEGGIDVILLDLTLPDSQGLPTFLKLRSVVPHVPIIVLTGVQDDQLAVQAVHEGAQDYLVKTDLTPGLLQRAVRYAAERQSALEALRESEQRFRSIIETCPDAIVMTDLEPKIILSNRQAAVNGGFDRPEALLGKNAFDLIAPEDHLSAREGMMVTLQTGVVRNREYTLLRQDGSRYSAELDASLVRDERGDPKAFTAIIRDITARKHLEDARQKYEFIVNTSETFMTLVDRSYTYEAVNDAYCFAHGRRREEIVGRTAEDVWGRELFETTLKPKFDTCFAGNEVTYEASFPFPALGIRSFDVSYHPYFDGRGNVSHAVVICHDITERMQIEQALAKAHLKLKAAHDELEERVEERTNELSQVNRDLETLLYVISHDLKEPLRAIENFSRLVRDRYGSEVDEKGKDFLNRVVRGAGRMSELLNDILVLSRVRRMEASMEEVDARLVVSEAISRLDMRIRQTKARVRIADDLPRLRVEKAWAVEALYNLVENALKFTVSGVSPDIEVAGYAGTNGGAGSIGVVVRDRGPGVPAEQMDRIFQLFQRGVGREIDGTGAGLAIVREIARRHGGSAWVQPRAGGGSEFVVTFASNGGD
ncbi:MAG: PAS domain S-box protein [Nitrospirae bacterium]|nr:PAS domain S-box protein [Nitrospirota bacterium]